MFKAILWDNDGVLVDTEGLYFQATRETIAWFVNHLPANVQLVISTRTDPALPLGTLRVRGQLLELRADELRFTAEEADEFLNRPPRPRAAARSRR